jgi:preprotein translocase subunit SecG
MGSVTFFSQMFEELAERRLRLHKAVRAFTAGLIEFFVLGGLTLGVLAVWLRQPLGVLPLIGFIVGCLLIEQRRQAALKAAVAAGGDELLVRRRSDMQVLAVSIAMALAGFLVFGLAMAAKEKEGWVTPEPPPPKVYDLEIVK